MMVCLLFAPILGGERWIQQKVEWTLGYGTHA